MGLLHDSFACPWEPPSSGINWSENRPAGRMLALPLDSQFEFIVSADDDCSRSTSSRAFDRHAKRGAAQNRGAEIETFIFPNEWACRAHAILSHVRNWPIPVVRIPLPSLRPSSSVVNRALKAVVARSAFNLQQNLQAKRTSSYHSS
jgi:hypothetical protein